MPHETFHYKSWADIDATARREGVSIPHSDDLLPLKAPLTIGACAAANRIALQPMEGTDGTEDGRPAN